MKTFRTLAREAEERRTPHGRRADPIVAWCLRQIEPFDTIDVAGRYGAGTPRILARLVKLGLIRRLAPGRFEVAR